MSYAQQVHTLYRLHLDPVFRERFRGAPLSASPGLLPGERAQLEALPLLAEVKGAKDPGGTFVRVGVVGRGRIAMPRTFALLDACARRAGVALGADLAERLWSFDEPLPEGFHRDELRPNPAVAWPETGRVLQMANRIYWQIYGYARGVAERQRDFAPGLAELARFEFETLYLRVVLYGRFLSPGPRPLALEPALRLRLSRYALVARYACALKEPLARSGTSGVVLLYNGERLRVLQVEWSLAGELSALDGRLAFGDLSASGQRAVQALAPLGVFEAVSA